MITRSRACSHSIEESATPPLAVHQGLGITLALAVAFGLIFLFSEGCKKEETIVNPSRPDTARTTPILNRILLIAYDRSWGKGGKICTINSDGSGFRRLSYPTDSISYSDAVWSPDLKHLAVVWNYYDLRRADYPLLSVADTNGNLQTFLANGYRFYSLPVWSPDGSQIAFSAGRQAFTVSASGGAAIPVTRYGGAAAIDTSAQPFGWTSDNTLLAMVSYDSALQMSGMACEMDLKGFSNPNPLCSRFPYNRGRGGR